MPTHVILAEASAARNIVTDTAATASTDAADAATAWALGDWGGARTALAVHGLDLEFVATTDILGVVDGGIRRGVEALSKFDLVFKLDTGTAGWWRNGSLQVVLLGTAGGSLSERAGDMQIVSNIEAPANTLIVYEANYEHHFLDDRVALLVGLHDLNADFYVLEHAGLFLNSSFGIGIEVAQVGASLFPVTAPGARLQIKMTPNTYLQAGVFDGVPGVPGDPARPHGTHITFDRGDGIFSIAEIGWLGEAVSYYKLALGSWYHSREFIDINNRTRANNDGIYLIGEKDLWRTEDGCGVGVFAQLGFTEGDRNQVSTSVAGGVNWTGPLPARPQDVAGLAVAHARNGERFRRLNPGGERAETTLEMSYLMQPAPWLTVQPDLQYVIHPSTDTSLDNALVLGVRLQVAF